MVVKGCGPVGTSLLTAKEDVAPFVFIMWPLSSGAPNDSVLGDISEFVSQTITGGCCACEELVSSVACNSSEQG